MKPRTWARASAWLPGAVGVFAILLALRIGRVAAVPMVLLVASAAVALAVTLAWTGLAIASVRRGPRRSGYDAATAVRCTGDEADLVRAAALTRSPAGGSGYARPAGRLAAAALGAGLTGILLSGLLNVALHVEGTWVQYAETGKDLDERAMYRDVDLGLFADPSDLRYGVVVGAVRPADPRNLTDVTVVNARGETIGQTTLGPGRTLHVDEMDLYQWGLGPGLHVTVVHKVDGQLFDDVVPLWPTGPAGEYGELIGGDGVELRLTAAGWPWPDAAPGDVRATLRKGPTVLYDGPVQARKVIEGGEGYAIIAWELRPYVALGVVHRTYRALTVWSMAVAAAGALAWALLRARPFWYREEPDGSVLVSPPAAWAALQRRARR